MRLTDKEMEIVDKISAITNKKHVSNEDIQEAKRLINTLPDHLAGMYDEAFFLIEQDQTNVD